VGGRRGSDQLLIFLHRASNLAYGSGNPLPTDFDLEV
jgi:hypothetical protein